MVPLHFPIVMVVLATLSRVHSIMVPTGKIGPITPAKAYTYTPPVQQPYRSPAPVWENVDETGSGYTPPVYKYTLYDFVQKYGHHTLIPRPEDYYNPPPRVYIAVKGVDPLLYKNYGVKPKLYFTSTNQL